MTNPQPLLENSIPSKQSESTEENMSSPVENSSSNHPSSPDNLFDYPIHLDELIHLLNNNEGRELLHATFGRDSTGDIILRMFLSITRQIDQLERYASGLRTERNDIYNYGMRVPRFEQRVTELIHFYRRRQGNPYLLTPPTPYQPTQATSSDDPSSHSESSPRSVVIHLEEASAIQEDQIRTNPSPHSLPRSLSVQPEEVATAPYHTVNEDEPGSSTNPINIDEILERARVERQRFDTPHPIVGILNRRYPSTPELSYCTICTRSGHLARQCIHRGVIICDYCRAVNEHLANQCPEWRRDIYRYTPRLQFCLLCGQSGHTIDRCAILNYSQ